MVRAAGGLPIFAHPSFTTDYEPLITELANLGLFGMEAYYKAYPRDLVEGLAALAERLGLFALGGSDYHAIPRNDEREPGDIPLPDGVVEEFLEAARAQGCAVPEPARPD